MGEDYWKGRADHEYSNNVWDLLQSSASDDYKDLLKLTDNPDRIIDSIKNYDPNIHQVR